MVSQQQRKRVNINGTKRNVIVKYKSYLVISWKVLRNPNKKMIEIYV